MYHVVNMDHAYVNDNRPNSAESQTLQQHCEMMTVDIYSLIAEVEKHSVLWDKNNLCYFDRAVRRAAWQEVYKALNPNFDQFPRLQQVLLGSAIERRWRSLREGFSKKVRNELQIAQRRRAPYIYHDQMHFLRKVITPRSNPAEDEDSPDSQCERRSTLEEKLTQFLEMQSQALRDDHQNFFDSVLPLVRKFNEVQAIGFRAQVLNLVQQIRASTPECSSDNLSDKSSDSISCEFRDGYQQEAAQSSEFQGNYQREAAQTNEFQGNYQREAAQKHSVEVPPEADQSAYVSQGPSSSSDSGIDSPVCGSSIIQTALCVAMDIHQNSVM